MIDLVVTGGLGFIISIILARYLGPETFGKYSFYVTIASLTCALASAGIMIILINRAIKKSWKFNFYISNTLSIFVFYSLPITVILTLLINYLFFTDIDFVYAVVFQFSMVFFGFCIHFYINLQRFDIVSFFNTSYRVLFIGIILLYVFILNKNLSLEFIFILNSIILILLFFFAMYFYVLKYKKPIHIYYKKKIYRKYILLSLPVLGAAISEFINLKVDTIMLGSLSTNYQLGLYSASYTIYLGFVMIPLAFTKVFNPIFIQRIVNDIQQAKKLFYQFFIFYSIYSVLIIVFIIFFTKEIINFTYGSDYFDAVKILFFLILALPFISINRLINYSMIALDKQKIYMYYTIYASILNITVNFFLIPIYGALGAVVATIITEFFVFLIGLIYVINFFHSNKVRV